MADPTAPASDQVRDKLLTLGVHEFRTPVAVISGFLKMLLSGKLGPLTDQQRNVLEHMDRSTAKLAALTNQMGDLTFPDGGREPFRMRRVDLAALIEGEIESLPPLADREAEIEVVFQNDAAGAMVHGDPVRLRNAIASLLIAHRRELSTTTKLCVRITRVRREGGAMLQVTIASADRMDGLQDPAPSDLIAFDEFREGVGFILPIACRTLAAHGATLWSAAENGKAAKAAAVLLLPEA